MIKKKVQINYEGKNVIADSYYFDNDAEYIVYKGHCCLVFGYHEEGEKMFFNR